jgi:hypothetical protein
MPAKIPGPAEIVDGGIQLLKESLPNNWQIQRIADDRVGDTSPDVVLNIAGPQSSARVVVEIKPNFKPRDVDAAVRQARLLSRVAGNIPVLVMSLWLSDRTRSLLTQAGINYLDLAGNLRFSSDYPTLFLFRESNVKGPKRTQGSPSLKGSKAGRLVRLLCDVQPPYGVNDLAAASRITAGYVSRLLDSLEADGFIERTTRGAVSRVDWQDLVRRRAESYAVFTSNRIERFVCPNGPAYALELAGAPQIAGQRIAVTGSFAAERVVSVAPPTLLILYTLSKRLPLIEMAGLLPAESGANVVIATPQDELLMELQWPAQTGLPASVPTVPASQIALDCLTGNGRMPQEGEAFLGWMGQNEDSWRLRHLEPVMRSPSSS